MKYWEYEKAFSAARLNKYLQACGNNTGKALTLYRYNVKLCQKFYGMLNIFEVVLRNAIDTHYRAYFNDNDWIRNQLGTGGMLEFHPQKISVLQTINDLDKSGRYSSDRIASSVTFGFWTYLFTKVPFRRGGQSLLKIFPQKEVGLGQRAIYNELLTIKDFRNRIAHHEAICFDSFGSKDSSLAKSNYSTLIKYVNFLGYSGNHLYFGLDILPHSVLDSIDNL